MYGATIEQVDLDVHEGDWLVFLLANDQKRWNGARLFIAAVTGDGKPVLETHAAAPWFSNDDPTTAAAFIAQYDSGKEKPAALIPDGELWDGISNYRRAFPDTTAEPIWGDDRVTWIKLRVPATTQPTR